MPAALQFYRGVLEFETVQETPDWAWLKRDNVEIMLNTAYEMPERPSEPDPARVAAHRDTIIYFGSPDVDSAYEFIAAKGWPVQPPKVAPYGMKQLHVLDPDGYALCFQWPVSE